MEGEVGVRPGLLDETLHLQAQGPQGNPDLASDAAEPIDQGDLARQVLGEEPG